MFKNRQEAGKLLAARLRGYKSKVLVLAIPRGGVVVGFEVAMGLGLPLDIIVIKKLGFPQNEELALGAVGLKEYYLNPNLTNSPEVTPAYISEQVKIKQDEVLQRYQLFRGKRKMYSVRGKTLILVDDGLATGATVIMALQILRTQKPVKIILAVPVAPADTSAKLAGIVDEIICLEQPFNFTAIGEFYEDFKQVEDAQAAELLHKAWKRGY